MNLIDTIDKKISMYNLTDYDKVRFIYLYCCQLFSFDARWYYTSLWNDQQLHYEILSHTIDLKNVDDFRVICHSISKEVLKKLIDEFTSYNSYIEGGNLHSNVIVDTFDEHPDDCSRFLKLDAVFDDMARVKLNVRPQDYTGSSFSYLKRLDSSLRFKFISEDDFVESIEKEKNIDTILCLKEKLNKYKLKNYSDVLYLFRLISSRFFGTIYVDNTYNFYHLIKDDETDKCFIVSLKNSYFSIDEISSKEYYDLETSSKLRCKKPIC